VSLKVPCVAGSPANLVEQEADSLIRICWGSHFQASASVDSEWVCHAIRTAGMGRLRSPVSWFQRRVDEGGECA
jgi:hypothetical protein